MKQREKPYEEIFDLLAIRVLVNTRPRLLPRARRHPRRVHAGAGAHQGLHRAAEVERLPVAAHDGVRAGAPAVRDPDPHEGDAPHRGLRHRGALAVQGGREERATSSIAHLTWFRQILELQLDAKTPDEFLEFLKLDLYQDEIFVFTPKGDVHPAAEGRDADRLRLRGALRGRAALRGREDQRAHRAAVARRCATRRRSRSSRRRRRGRAATGWRMCARAARATRSASGSATRSTRRR